MILKLTSSGKAFQVICEDGSVFQSSRVFLEGLLNGKSPSGFLLLTRMHFRVDPKRYKPSPVWCPDSQSRELYEESRWGCVG